MMASVRIYSTLSCPYCIKAKAYLDQKNIPYENFDVSNDKGNLEEMIKLSGQMSVPVLDTFGDKPRGLPSGYSEGLTSTAT